jgi:hypothetical protein
MSVAVRFAPAAALPELEAALAREGLHCTVLDGGAVKDGAHLLDALGRALAFPAYYGRNWDAAEECLGDLGERYPNGAALLIDRAGALWQRLSREMGLLTALWLATSKTAPVPLRLIFLLEQDS